MHDEHCLDLLDAYVDGELPADERATVQAHVETCAACGSALASLAATSRKLQEDLVRYVAPDVLKARIRSALADASDNEPLYSPTLVPSASPAASRSRWLRIAAGVAAAVVIAAASSATTLAVARRDDSAQRLANDVLTSHIRSLMPGHLVDVASTNQHNVKPWFNGRVNLSPPVPALDSVGFPLIGGRLDYLDGHPAATVVYMRRQHVINIYSWPVAGASRDASSTTSSTSTTSRSAQGYHLVSWQAGDIEYCVVSDLNANELADFVALYRRANGESAR